MDVEWKPRGPDDPEPWVVGHERFETEDDAQRFAWAQEEEG